MRRAAAAVPARPLSIAPGMRTTTPKATPARRARRCPCSASFPSPGSAISWCVRVGWSAQRERCWRAAVLLASSPNLRSLPALPAPPQCPPRCPLSCRGTRSTDCRGSRNQTWRSGGAVQRGNDACVWHRPACLPATRQTASSLLSRPLLLPPTGSQGHTLVQRPPPAQCQRHLQHGWLLAGGAHAAVSATPRHAQRVPGPGLRPRTRQARAQDAARRACAAQVSTECVEGGGARLLRLCVLLAAAMHASQLALPPSPIKLPCLLSTVPGTCSIWMASPPRAAWPPSSPSTRLSSSRRAGGPSGTTRHCSPACTMCRSGSATRPIS